MSDYPKAPFVGENLVWYPHGDVNQAPHAATVTARMSDECITVYTLSPTGRREPMLNIRHINHPYYVEHKIPLKRWGAWDVIGAHEERVKGMERISAEKKSRSLMEAEKNIPVTVETMTNPDEDEMRVIKISRELGESPGRAQSVADRIGAGMTHQRVNAILRKYPHFLTGDIPEEVVEVN